VVGNAGANLNEQYAYVRPGSSADSQNHDCSTLKGGITWPDLFSISAMAINFILFYPFKKLLPHQVNL